MKIRSLFTALCMLSVAFNGFAEQTVSLTNGEFPPYLSENLKYYGVASRIIAEAFA